MSTLCLFLLFMWCSEGEREGLKKEREVLLLSSLECINGVLMIQVCLKKGSLNCVSI